MDFSDTVMNFCPKSESRFEKSFSSTEILFADLSSFSLRKITPECSFFLRKMRFLKSLSFVMMIRFSSFDFLRTSSSGSPLASSYTENTSYPNFRSQSATLVPVHSSTVNFMGGSGREREIRRAFEGMYCENIAGLNIFFCKIRILIQNFLKRRAGRKQSEHKLNTESCAANDRFARKNFWISYDFVQKCIFVISRHIISRIRAFSNFVNYLIRFCMGSEKSGRLPRLRCLRYPPAPSEPLCGGVPQPLAPANRLAVRLARLRAVSKICEQGRPFLTFRRRGIRGKRFLVISKTSPSAPLHNIISLLWRGVAAPG